MKTYIFMYIYTLFLHFYQTIDENSELGLRNFLITQNGTNFELRLR